MSKNNKGIDYSKWDHLDYGSSSDDDGEQHNNISASSTPRVTRLDEPSCITRTSQGEIIVQEQQNQQQHVPPTASSSSAKPQQQQQQQDSIGSSCSIPTSWTEKGSTETINGNKIYWCQDRYTVTIRIMLFPATTTTTGSSPPSSSWYCNCTNVLPYDQRYSAVLSSTTSTTTSSSLLPHLIVGQRQRRGAGGDDRENDNVILLESDIPYPIHADECDDDDNDNTIDWSIETFLDDQNNKYMIILLKKATPVMGMTLWWKKLLVVSENEINVDWTDNDNSNNKFAESWKFAHEQFRKNREREKEQQQQQQH